MRPQIVKLYLDVAKGRNKWEQIPARLLLEVGGLKAVSSIVAPKVIQLVY